eukprot:CAMPEP_0176209726 /NCGR_PEP_ID=MMETSP0121_2-20121125/13779_1 /TAXON_ID=160619 /ORGANISM="Kryptoperidinium foliaceum, Strain CCMP 1326" /LENGTH=325 /DNA_ID=CAMNT_0017548741 /DNA_START=1 /DNA_END=975 /DNA_ORIENTATION=+
MPLRGVALALLGCAALGQRAPLSLLQWNPHWQCVVWNSRNCTEEAGKALVATLEGEDVDFANLIEYADPAGILPENWTNIRNAGLCGRDSLDLIYNSARWTPVIGMWPSRGCMQVIPADRPYLIMEFVGEQDLGHVVVVAAHFPHPRSYWDRTMDELFELRKGLRDFLNGTSTRRVIIIADTNEFSHTSNYDIMEYLKVPEGPIVGTALRATCCYDNDFAGWTTFDRIIANFGAVMETTVLFDPVPDWGKEAKNGTKGAFHKGVHAWFYLDGGAAPVPMKRVHVWILSAVILLVALVGAGILGREALRRGRPTAYAARGDDVSES